MATLKNKVSLRIAEQFPEFVSGDNAGVITFLEKYYQFLESAELVLTTVSEDDRVLSEEGTTDKIVLQSENIRTEVNRPEDFILLEENTTTAFVNGEIITGGTSKATATIRVEDINANSRLFISSQNLFLIEETITGGTSGATATISTYRANPVQTIQQLMDYADIDNTVDTFFDQFKEEFLQTIPKSLATGVNKRNLLKNIKDLYRAKGTRKGHELFFRLLLNEDVDVYYPNSDMMKVSDGNWSDEVILRVSADNDCVLMEQDIDSNTFMLNEDGSQVVQEDSTLDTSAIINLVGQVITQASVRDATLESGGIYESGGFSAISAASGTVESITQYQLGSVTVSELVLSDSSVSGTFVVGQNITGTDNTNTNLTVTAKIASVLSGSSVTTSSQYYATSDPISVTAANGNDARVSISTLSVGSISEILVSAAGSNYEIDDVVTITNTSTTGTGLTAVVSVVNGSIAPETGSLTTEFNLVIEAGGTDGSGTNAGDDLLTEDTAATFITLEENYGMVATDHFVLEDNTVSADNFSGDKIVQEIGSGSGDITDVRVTGLGENYTALPSLTLPTTGSRTGGVIIPKGTNVGKIASVQVDDPGIDYTGTVTLLAQTNFLVTAPSGTFTVNETLTGGTSSKTATFKSLNTATGVMKVASPSGAFTVGETLTGGSSSVTAVLNSYTAPSLSGTIGTNHSKAGYYLNQDGFLSESSKKIQDSYYYQDYSYVVKTGTAIAQWRNDLIASVHPAGWAVFGQIDSATSLNVRIREASTAPEALTARALQSPELFSLFTTIFITKLGRRLGGSSQTANPNPNVGVGRNTALAGDKEVSIVLYLQTNPSIWSTTPPLGAGGVMIGNAEIWKYHTTPSLIGRMELEAATGPGSVVQETTNVLYQGDDYIVGDGFQQFRTHYGYYEKRDLTTLNEGGTLAIDDTTITLTSATNFPTQGTIVIENEQITYTGKSGNNLTGCTRGADIQGTTDAATHADGTNVFLFKFVHENAQSYRIQDWANAVIGDVINYPKKRYHIPPPSEVTLSYT